MQQEEEEQSRLTDKIGNLLKITDLLDSVVARGSFLTILEDFRARKIVRDQFTLDDIIIFLKNVAAICSFAQRLSDAIVSMKKPDIPALASVHFTNFRDPENLCKFLISDSALLETSMDILFRYLRTSSVISDTQIPFFLEGRGLMPALFAPKSVLLNCVFILFAQVRLMKNKSIWLKNKFTMV
jgi:hypothetical protein